MLCKLCWRCCWWWWFFSRAVVDRYQQLFIWILFLLQNRMTKKYTEWFGYIRKKKCHLINVLFDFFRRFFFYSFVAAAIFCLHLIFGPFILLSVSFRFWFQFFFHRENRGCNRKGKTAKFHERKTWISTFIGAFFGGALYWRKQ